MEVGLIFYKEGCNGILLPEFFCPIPQEIEGILFCGIFLISGLLSQNGTEGNFHSFIDKCKPMVCTLVCGLPLITQIRFYEKVNPYLRKTLASPGTLPLYRICHRPSGYRAR